MKQYFIKFLPVNEEYENENDLFIFKIGGRWTGPACADDYLGDQIEEVKKVKPFMCSTEIKEGDTYYMGDNPQPLVSHSTHWEQDGVQQDILSHEIWSMLVYKKIGEVVEGYPTEKTMFDRNDFVCKWQNSKGEMSFTLSDIQLEDGLEKMVVMIK